MTEPGSSKLPPSDDHEQRQGQSALMPPTQDWGQEAATPRPEGVPEASTTERSAGMHEERHATADQQHRRERQKRKNNREPNERSRSRHRRDRDRSASLSTTASAVSKRTRHDSLTPSTYEDASAPSSDEDDMQTQEPPTSSSLQSDGTTPRQAETALHASQELFSYANSTEKLETIRDAGALSQDAFEDYGDEGVWKVQRRKHNQTRPEKETPPETFVLVVKPRINVALTTVPGKDLHRNFVMAAPAAANTKPFTYTLQPASNTIRLLVHDKRQADGLLKLSHLDVNHGQIPVQVYQAPGRDMCRGVIYNVDCNETKAELRAALTCEHRRILDARPMGKRGACLLTFEGRHPPNRVVYYGRITRVSIYEPKSIVCNRCHRFGHKKDVCPHEAVCPTCGKTHEGSTTGNECKQTKPRCRNCEEEGHTATDPKCPAKLKSDAQIAKKLRSRPRSRRRRHGAHRSRSRTRTVQCHDVKLTQQLLESENISTQPRTIKEAVNEIVSKNLHNQQRQETAATSPTQQRSSELNQVETNRHTLYAIPHLCCLHHRSWLIHRKTV